MVQIRFDPEIVRCLNDLPSRRFDDSRTRWLVAPIPEAAHELLWIAEAYGFAVPEDARAELTRIGSLYRQVQADPRLASVQRYLYRAPDFQTLVSLPRNFGIAEEVTDLLGAVWDKRIGAFRLEATARNADSILDLTREFDFFVAPSEYERLVSMGYLLFEEEFFTYDPLSATDRILYRMLMTLPKLRREHLFDAVRNYRNL